MSPSFQLPAELLVGGGPWGGSPGLGRSCSVPPCPLQLELLDTEPLQRESPHPPHMLDTYRSELWGLLPDFVPRASPERDMLWQRESPRSLLPDRERKQHMVFLPPLAGLESSVGRGISQLFNVFSRWGR